MGIVDGIRGVYFSLEDRYYSFLDALESKGIPVYKVVDPIDSVVPSFPLFVLIVLLLLGGLLWFLVLPNLSFGNAQLNVKVLDFSDSPISGASVTVIRNGTQTIGVSDALGKTAFDFPKGSEIAVSVSREGFDNFEVPAFVLSESREVTARLSTAGSASGEAVIRTIRLLSQSGQPLVGEDITVSFSCSNSAANPPAEVTVTTGEVKVTEPGNCGGLVAQIRSRNFKEVASFPVSQLVNTAYLISNSAALEEDRGTIEVLVTENNQAVSDGLSIVLYPFESDISVDSAPVQNGKAVFSNVAFGKYVVKNRGTSDFAPTSATLTLSSKRQTVSLALQKNVAGKIVVKVIDADTRKPVPNSTVSLRIGNDEVEKKTTSDDGNGSLEFFVPRDTTYNVGVSHPDYCFETRSDLGINKSYSIELEPFTASCGGTIVVKVVDQEGIPVQNALVSLASEQQFFLGAGQEISDLNGVARFAGIKAGTYTAFAFKGTSSGWSDPKFFNRKKGETEQVDLIATLQIPNGIVRIQVVDKENRPVPFATITFVDAFDNQIVGGGAKPADSNGVLSWETRADKTVYAIVEKEGFASVASQWIEVKPSTIQEEQVQLLPPITQFEVELVGLFSGNLSTPPAGSPTASLAAGQEYVARFRIKIPSDRSFSSDHPFNQVGIHVRTGTEGIMEKDFIFLKETNAPSASVVRSTSFTGKYVSDLAAVTSSDAKWANMTWTRPRADVIMAQIVVKVKENAALGKKLDIFYRAWGGQNGDVVRDPADQTGGGQELYSDAKDASFTVGVGTLCDERFCFDASIYDQRDALRMPVTDSFAARNLENYTLSFAIGNTSKMDTDTYRNAELRLEAIEENLLFKQYTIFDAASEGSKPITGTANAAALPRITIGDLSPGRRISGDIAFMPKIPGTHTIDFRIVDTDLGQIVFSKQLSIISIADNDFVIVVSPEKLSPGIENPVIITVTDKVTGLPVKDAFVRLRDKFKNILSTSQTNSLGIVETRLPAQAPGEILDIEVERVEYNTLIKKVTVDGEILTLSPERLGFSVNPKSKPTDAKEFKISNVAPFELAIESVSLSGKFSGLLDLDSTNNALHSWAGAKIKANDFVSISVPVKTSTQATDLEALTDLSGVLTVRVSSQGHAWDFEIPVQITVGLGGEVDDPACLTLSQTEWVSSSQGKPIVLEFSIQNNCSIAGKPVDISNVETRIAWIGNQTGEFELSTDVSNSILRSGYFLTILPKLEAGKSVVARLTFTPNAQVIGSTKATVEFQATNPTDSAPQTLSAQLSADLDVVNLLSCVSYDKEYIEMQAEETFNPKVSAVGFGVSQSINPITGRVTAGDDNSTTVSAGIRPLSGSQERLTIKTADCGGATSFSLESELKLSPTEFSLSDNGAQQIVITADDRVPGQYGVKVLVKGAGAVTTKQIKTIPVVLAPARDECVLLTKFEYNVFRNEDVPGSGIDTAKVINQCYDKPVQVMIDRHSLDDAMAEGQRWAAMGLAMGMMGQMNQNGGLFSGLFGGSSNDSNASPGSGSNSNTPPAWKEFKDAGTVLVANGTGGFVSANAYKDNAGNEFVFENGMYYPVRQRSDGRYEKVPNGAPVASNGSVGSTATGPNASVIAQKESEIAQLNSQISSEQASATSLGCPNGKPECQTSIDRIHSLNVRISSLESEISGLQTTPLTGRFSLTGYQFLPFAGQGFFGSGSTNSDAENECSFVDSDGTLSKSRQDADSEISSLQTLPMFASLLGGGNMGNAFSQAMMMYAMGTAQAYNAQTDVCIWTVQRDVQLGSGGLGGVLDNLASFFTGNQAKGVYKLLDSTGIDDRVFSGVSVEEYRKPIVSPRKDNQELSTETRFIKVSNDDGLVQADALNPLFAMLAINGVRHVYLPEQIYESQKPSVLKEGPSQKLSSKFHIQLNSYKPEPDSVISPEIGNCQIGQKIGSTGPNAVPRLKFAWGWNEINFDSCDSDNPEYIYCDATQFSIALLKKMEVLREFTTVNALTFECPSAVSSVTPTEQALSKTGLDIGVTKLEIVRNQLDANMVATVENSNNVSGSAELTTIITNTANGKVEKTCIETVSFLSKTTSGCLVQNLAPGEYRVKALLGAVSCTGCQNAVSFNDSLEDTFTTGFEGLACAANWTNTSHLEEIIAATEGASKSLVYPAGFDKEKIVKLASFRAHLMKDGYSTGFRKDFHSYALTQSLFQTPEFYSQPDGLGEYFSDPAKMQFEYFGSPNGTLSEPGIYQVDLDVNFSDQHMAWFENSTPVATILVTMEKTGDAKPASPFYYYPLDGALGLQNGRVGYGTNFELETPDKPIVIAATVDRALLSQSIPGSIPAATVKAYKITDFATLNVSNRGLLFSIDSQTDEWKLAPSLATPVIMKVSATSTADAFGFYSLEVDSQPQTNLPFLSRWSGISPSCKDFAGDGLDKYSETPDISGVNAHCSALGPNSAVSYGFEWCNRKLPGTVSLQSVFFTPTESSAVLRLTGQNESVSFIGLQGSGQNVELAGVPGMAFNSHSNAISSVQDVLDLVAEGQVCVTGSENAVRTEFFWNPKVVLDGLAQVRDATTQACIQ